jgi:hypothetical protein
MAQKCRFPQDYDTVRPYTPVEILENGTASTFRFGILNRNISVSKMGLPDAIAVARPQTQHGTLPAKVSNLLLSPFKLLVVPTGGGAALTFEPTESPQVRRDGDGKVRNRKRLLLHHCIKNQGKSRLLPRQARDKHRENSKTKWRFP